MEVKLRKNADFGEAREFVTSAKQRRVIRAAELWLMKTGCELQPRFDVIEIYAPEGMDTVFPRSAIWKTRFPIKNYVPRPRRGASIAQQLPRGQKVEQ